MFLELIMPPPASPPAEVLRNVDSLFLYTPLQISALVETTWRNRYNAVNMPLFTPWPETVTHALLEGDYISSYNFGPGPVTANLQSDFSLPSVPGKKLKLPKDQPGMLTPAGKPRPSIWAHLMYAYLIENTRIFDVFARLLETYAFSEELETPSPAGQSFWRNTEYLLYGDGIPSMIWTTASRARRDEIANRQTVYNWMFGIDLSHAGELAKDHPYTKPTASNRDFIPTFEEFGREVWGGIMNAKNISGPNQTDPVAISTAARRLFDMMATRRLNGNLSREEFRAVALMSWLHLAVMYDSPVVVNLKATASSPEQRLAKLAARVGLSAHTKAKPLFDLAQPFSFLMHSIEQGTFNDPAGAALLYNIGGVAELNAEVVIDQYGLATGHDLKASNVVQRQQPGLRPATHTAPAAHAAHARTNGHTNGRPALTR